MRSSTIHALACAFLHATLRITLSGSPFGLSLSRMNACMSASWFLCHHSLKIKSEKGLPPLRLLSSKLSLSFSHFGRLSSRLLCILPGLLARGQPESSRAGLPLLSGSLGTCSLETTAGEGIIIPTHTHTHQEA